MRLQRPSQDEIAARMSSADGPLSYPEVGATADSRSLEALPDHYDLDRHEFVLGTGHDLFERACAALASWQHFGMPWLELHGGTTPPSEGQVVATLTRVAGLWFLNPCRVVYTEGLSSLSSVTATATEVAFAYGTLAGHVESGEERFTVRLDPTTEAVTYEILAFSRPAILLTRLAKPWARRVQRRFAVSSFEALARACVSASGGGRNR